MYRVFGSPFGLATHQSAMYLRHKQLQHTIYSSSFLTTRLAGMWHRAPGSYGCLGPNREWFLNWHDLHAHCEMTLGSDQGGARLTVPSLTHPRMKIVELVIDLYASWWLLIVGGTFRWVHGEGSDTGKAHASFFLMTTLSPIADPLSKMLRDNVRKSLKFYGVRPETEPYVLHHFASMCFALDAHFAKYDYILGTPHPTTADVTLAAAFEGQFLKDDPPRTDLLDGTHKHLMQWVRKMGTSFEEDLTSAAADAKRNPFPKGSRAEVMGQSLDVKIYKDEVPDTLTPLLKLTIEVLPWLAAQCEALSMWKAAQYSDKEALVNVKHHDGRIEAVKAHKAARLLDQPWAMAVDDQTLDLHVSMPHVHMARLLADEIQAVELPEETVRGDVRKDLVPREVLQEARETLLGCSLGDIVTAPVVDGGADFYYGVWRKNRSN